MTLLALVNTKLITLTVLGHLLLAAAVLYLVFLRKKYPGPAAFLNRYGLAGIFIVSLAATTGSLYYSYGAGYTPCDLCWLQRIFMYPVLVLSGLALLKKERKIIDYILALAVLGGAISLFHNYIYYFGGPLSRFCQAGGLGASCLRRYVFGLGYITIPLMALTAFALIIALVIFVKLQDHE